MVDAGDHAIPDRQGRRVRVQRHRRFGVATAALISRLIKRKPLIGGPQVVVSALIERHAVMVRQNDGGYQLPSSAVGETQRQRNVGELLQQLGINAHPGFVYSDDRQKHQQHIVFLCARRPTPVA
ncbi:hypothetical protein M8494_11100 [Serratia ureilytica]